MPRNPKIEVSFVVLNWRKPERTLAAIESIRALVGPAAEVIVVDNESQPDELNRLKSAADHVIVNKENHGFARGCNEGARVAKGTYLAFVNNDAVLPKRWLEIGLNALNQDRSLGAVAGGERIAAKRSYSLSRVHPRTAMVYQNVDAEVGIIPAPYSYGSNLLIRRRAFEEVGGFEESYFAYYEDVDLGAKLAARSIGSAYVADMTITHEVGASTGSAGSDFRNRLIQRNKYRYIARHFAHWPLFLVWAALHDILKFMVGNLVIVLKRQSSTAVGAGKQSVYRAQLHASGWAISHIAPLARSRRQLIRDKLYSPTLRRELAMFNSEHQPRR